jgi:restriction system protein
VRADCPHSPKLSLTEAAVPPRAATCWSALVGDRAVWDYFDTNVASRRRAIERDKRDRERVLREFDEERQTIAKNPNRTERAQQMRQLRERQEKAGEEFTNVAHTEMEQIGGLLQAAASEPARDLAYLRSAISIPPPPTAADVPAPDRPRWAQFAPPEPGLFGRRRYERDVTAARAAFETALMHHDQTIADRLAALRNDHAQRVAELRRSHEAKWATIASQIAAGDADAVDTLIASALLASPQLHGVIEGGRTTFDHDARELVLEIDIPDTDVVPNVQAWKYVVTRTSTVPVPVKPAESAILYAALVAQLVLAVIDTTFRAIAAESVDVVSINGHVRTVDPATGKAHHPCLITVTTDRPTFEDLDLRHPRLDPKACLRRLGAEISQHPHDLEHIEPIVNFDLRKYRIARGPEALAKIDHRMDLLEMDAYEFERLVENLFTKMGYDTWRTESRRDDGIDAVATKSDPHMPVECIVQAKRARGAVAPKEVQALMGAMAEKPTATHGYLVTTSWLSPRSRQRARGQRIHTIERNELAALIKKHLGVDVVISNSVPAYQEGGSRPARSAIRPPSSP